MALGYILIYPCSYHGKGIYLEYVPIVPFDVRCQSGIWKCYIITLHDVCTEHMEGWTLSLIYVYNMNSWYGTLQKTLQNFANMSRAFANSSRRFANSSQMLVYALGCEPLYTWLNSMLVLLFALSRTVCEWFSSRSWRLTSVCEVHKLNCSRTMTFCTREWRRGTSSRTADFIIFRLAD